MRNRKKGSVTILFALSMTGFLAFCLTLVEGARIYCLRTKAEQAMELAAFSVLSEYQQELFDHYGLFFLDLNYEQETEYTAVLEQRAEKYLQKNAPELVSIQTAADNFRRSTDNGGIPFLKQAVLEMKEQTGYQLLEDFLGKDFGWSGSDAGNLDLDLQELLGANKSGASGILEGYVDSDGNPLFQISLPSISFPTIDGLTEAVFGNRTGLSEKTIDLGERIQNRSLKRGTGTKETVSLTDQQWFHGYLFQHFGNYLEESPQGLRETLDYQMEYIIAGKESDVKNLEDIMWRIFLARAGGNYLFYHQDTGRMAKAEADAAALVGITGNAALIGLVREIFLIAEAIEEGIGDTKRVFSGEKVPLYQNGIFSGISLGYSEYLFLFLNLTDLEEKTCRSMDVVELEVREKSGYEYLKLDHCTDSFTFMWNYQFESLFETVPFLNSGSYEHTLARNIFYEQ